MSSKTKKFPLIIILALFSLFFAQLSNAFVVCRTDYAVLAVAEASITRGHAPLRVDLNGIHSAIGQKICDTNVSSKFIASYSWKSALGHYASGAQTQMVFDTPGIHKIDLIVKNNYGRSDTTSISVTVLDETPSHQDLQQEFNKGIRQGHASNYKCVLRIITI